jgi:hypothetical protein
VSKQTLATKLLLCIKCHSVSPHRFPNCLFRYNGIGLPIQLSTTLFSRTYEHTGILLAIELDGGGRMMN